MVKIYGNLTMIEIQNQSNFECDKIHCSNLDLLESKLPMIRFGSPNGLRFLPKLWVRFSRSSDDRDCSNKYKRHRAIRGKKSLVFYWKQKKNFYEVGFDGKFNNSCTNWQIFLSQLLLFLSIAFLSRTLHLAHSFVGWIWQWY